MTITGPCLSVDPPLIEFEAAPSYSACEKLTLTNDGTVCLDYSVIRVANSDNSDTEFFQLIGTSKGKILPGDAVTIKFTFSPKTQGIFLDEWLVQCHPRDHKLNNFRLKLAGVSWSENPALQEKLVRSKHAARERHISIQTAELVDDIISLVKTPPSTPPSASPELAIQYSNPHLHCSANSVHAFSSLWKDVCSFKSQCESFFTPPLNDMCLETLSEILSTTNTATAAMDEVKAKLTVKIKQFTLANKKLRSTANVTFPEALREFAFNLPEKLNQSRDHIDEYFGELIEKYLRVTEAGDALLGYHTRLSAEAAFARLDHIRQFDERGLSFLGNPVLVELRMAGDFKTVVAMNEANPSALILLPDTTPTTAQIEKLTSLLSGEAPTLMEMGAIADNSADFKDGRVFIISDFRSRGPLTFDFVYNFSKSPINLVLETFSEFSFHRNPYSLIPSPVSRFLGGEIRAEISYVKNMLFNATGNLVLFVGGQINPLTSRVIANVPARTAYFGFHASLAILDCLVDPAADLCLREALLFLLKAGTELRIATLFQLASGDAQSLEALIGDRDTLFDVLGVNTKLDAVTGRLSIASGTPTQGAKIDTTPLIGLNAVAEFTRIEMHVRDAERVLWIGGSCDSVNEDRLFDKKILSSLNARLREDNPSESQVQRSETIEDESGSMRKGTSQLSKDLTVDMGGLNQVALIGEDLIKLASDDQPHGPMVSRSPKVLLALLGGVQINLFDEV